ncbi:AraC family transcriptional regulator [Nocardia sp. NBC_00565]|uniref:AraC family transcriptional regulator n=1 Tax=Nocardia sp. NBC_00565 TaxID=2975993 RepID=UPI002E81AF19|nr:AraC family transcriptional regulator [Nocardia sp. NBC_00565]WUC05410.1 AraC family transcriptional regulator [Nocardia sp. NBC_00565]
MKALVTSGATTSPRSMHDAPGTPGELRWEGTALLRAGVLAFGGTIGPTSLHAHHAVRVVAACTPVVVVDASGIRHRGTHVIVPADAPHRIATGAERGTAIYLDPESVAGAAADRRAHTYGWADSAHSLPIDPERETLADLVADVVDDLERDNTQQVEDDRHEAVTDALELLPSLVGDGPIRGADVARRVGISATRLTHLFTAQVGIPLRPYILWLRLHVAITRVRSGDDLTAAAHAAGFADSSHLTRTCRRTFGLPPSALSRRIQWDLGDAP